MVEVRIDRVSKYGVMIDGQWINWSKNFKPLDVKKGDVLDVTLDSKGHIIYATIVGGDVPNALVEEIKGIVDKDMARSREILKGQCLNLVFSKLEGNIKSPSWRKEAIELSVTLFAELQHAGYLRW